MQARLITVARLQGLSLLELLVGLFIVSILLGLGLQPFSALLSEQRVVAATREPLIN